MCRGAVHSLYVGGGGGCFCFLLGNRNKEAKTTATENIYFYFCTAVRVLMLLLADTTSECLPKTFVGLMYFLFIRRSPSTYFHILFLYFLFSRSFPSDAVPFLSPHPCNCIHNAHFNSICINRQYYKVLLVNFLFG
jgi:hypothetical protein